MNTPNNHTPASQAADPGTGYVAQRDALGLLLRVFVSKITEGNPQQVAFWMPTTGPRAGQIVWGDPHRRFGHRPEDEAREVPEDVMSWDDIVRHVRAGHTAEQINDDLHERTANMRTRWGF